MDSRGHSVESALPGADGRFATTVALPSGSYYAKAFGPSGFLHQLYAGVSCGAACPSQTTGTPVTVTAGATTPAIDFPLVQGGVITGRVGSVNGAALADVTVTVTTAGGVVVASATTNADGQYSTATSIPAGSYYVTASSVRHVTERYWDVTCDTECAPTSGTPVAVAQGATVSSVDFLLYPGAIVTGTVESGIQPVPGVRVTAYNAAGTPLASATTDGSGAYSIQVTGGGEKHYFVAFPPAPYSPEIYGFGRCSASCEARLGVPVTLYSGATRTGIDFYVVKNVPISGRVTDSASGTPMASVTINVFGPVGDLAWSGSTDGAGGYLTPLLIPASYYVQAVPALLYLTQVYSGVNCGSPCAWWTSLWKVAPPAIPPPPSTSHCRCARR